jgi:glycolate oxidase FAD binding subunit
MRPESVEELAGIIADAVSAGEKLELCGGGSKAETGGPRQAHVIDLTAFRGVVDYDPSELVLTVRAGTFLTDVEEALAEQGQMLAFEPFDYAPIFGRSKGLSTIGGVIAAGVSGPRRLSRGAARDHLLGFKAVSGRGEAFAAGGRVVKNVTGYDLCKLMTGSWGRLAALTEVSLKVLPRPQMERSLAIQGLEPAAAVELMARAMGSQADVAAAAHEPGFTVLRLEGFGPSVDARAVLLRTLAPGLITLAEDDATQFWARLQTPLRGRQTLWRISAPPSRAPEVIGALDGDWVLDWAGGRIWSSCEDPAAVRPAAEAAGGHAMLVRGPLALRASIPALHPQPAGVAALEERVRRGFDPAGVFETGRF